MGKMQVVIDGVQLDNASWRAITGGFGDSPGGDNQRVLTCEFRIEAATAESLQTRLLEAYELCTRTNARVTFTNDDAAANFFADVSPNDGKHTSVHCTVGVAAGHEQTATAAWLMLYVVAGMTPPVSSGPAGANQAYYQGLQGSLKYTRTLNAARIEVRSLLATFIPTFDDDANGPYTVSSVETASGKARFVLSTAPVAFVVGQRLKVTAGTGYLGVHLITAIDTGTKKVTTDTAFTATATGTAYIGTLTSGETNYNNAKNSLLATYLGTENDGSRKASTGLSLITEIPETTNANGDQYTVLLQSGPMQAMANTASARVANLSIRQSEPEKWNTKFGQKPLWLSVKGSLSCSKDVLASESRTLFAVWAASAQGDILTLVKAKTGRTDLKLLDVVHESDDGTGVIAFEVKYQARNQTVLAGSIQVSVREHDDSVSIRETEGYDYDQRPPGFKPKTCTIAISRIGVGKVDLSRFVQLPPTGGGTWKMMEPLTSEERVDCLFSGNLYSQTYTVGYERRNYRGAGGAGAVAAGASGSGGSFIDGYFTPTGPDV